jgi:hypothetical protein
VQIFDIEFYVHSSILILYWGFFREFLGLGKQRTQDGSREDGICNHYVAKGGNDVWGLQPLEKVLVPLRLDQQ